MNDLVKLIEICFLLKYVIMLSSAVCNFLEVVFRFLAEANILISSANCDRFVVGVVGVGISLTYMMNNIGLKELPWGTPKLSLISGEVRPLSSKKRYRSEMKLLMHLMNMVGSLILMRV